MLNLKLKLNLNLNDGMGYARFKDSCRLQLEISQLKKPQQKKVYEGLVLCRQIAYVKQYELCDRQHSSVKNTCSLMFRSLKLG